MTIISGKLTGITNAPSMSDTPPKSSVNVVAQAVICGNGTPMLDRISPNPAGPRLSLAQPWAANPKPKINLSKRLGQPRALACFWNLNTFLNLKCLPAQFDQKQEQGQSGRQSEGLQIRHRKTCRAEAGPSGEA